MVASIHEDGGQGSASPRALATQYARFASERGRSWSEIAGEALQGYPRQLPLSELRERLKLGYLQMGAINLELAEEGMSDPLEPYETRLAGAE